MSNPALTAVTNELTDRFDDGRHEDNIMQPLADMWIAARQGITAKCDRRFRYCALVLLWLTSWALIAMHACGCAHAVNYPPPSPRDMRDMDARDHAAMSVETWCVDGDVFDGGTGPLMAGIDGKSGSAVAVSPNRLITAAHVVECPAWTAVRVRLPDGTHVPATLRAIDHDLDIALLYVDEPLTVQPAHVRAAALGETVCQANAQPQRGYLCGQLVAKTTGGNDLLYTAATAHGNSGAGLYSADGALLGIVTELTLAGDGKATSLAGRHPDWYAP